MKYTLYYITFITFSFLLINSKHYVKQLLAQGNLLHIILALIVR